ncbi:MAG: IclR family transcriptional regulator, partial [Deltaproteobacteria bacterium]|nr:IclR family transcriptional regulator [Deltaproteobacteria bacterium]
LYHTMATRDKEENEYRVQALERALDILECFSLQVQELNLSEIAAKTGLNKTTAKRLVSNLTRRGYLKRLDSKRYRLGLRLFQLGGVVRSSLNIREAASGPMSQIQRQTGATVLLGAAMENQLVLIDKKEGGSFIRISADVGWRGPLNFGMLGMVLMAYLEPGEVKRILRRDKLQAYTPFSITDEEAFSLRLEHIRHQGYVVEKGEAIEGIVGIAAPIRDFSREVIAAMGIVLTYEQARNGVDEYVELVRGSCDMISRDLGYLAI